MAETAAIAPWLDTLANLLVAQREAVTSPGLLGRGEHDGIARIGGPQHVFARLQQQGYRQFPPLSRAAHALDMGLDRALFGRVM